jgi:pimeloyl-ACP methyl ester carboxylesterase
MVLETAMEHLQVDVGSVRLHCVTRGEGQLVVLLHGFPEFWYSWRHQIPHLARSFKVVAPDMSVAEYSLDRLTADVKGLIEAFGEKSAIIVGHDWGGAVAWSFAMAYPSYVDRLVVLNAPHPAAFARQIRTNPRQLRRSWYMFFFQIPVLPEMALSAFDYYVLKRSFSDWAINKEAFTDEDLDVLAAAASMPGALRGGLNYYRAMMRNPKALGALLKNVPVIESPTLLIWAEEDRSLGMELTYGLTPYFSDGITVKYIPDCSHWVQQEQPVVVNEMLDDFLGVRP